MFNQMIQGGFSGIGYGYGNSYGNGRPPGPPPHGPRGQNGRPPGPPPPGGPRPGGQGQGGGFGSQIQQGIQNGTISQTEAQSLSAPLQEMQQYKQSAMADGQVTQEEHAQLKAYGDQMRQMISQYSS